MSAKRKAASARGSTATIGERGACFRHPIEKRARASRPHFQEIKAGRMSTLPFTPTSFTIADLEAVPPEYRKIIPEYIKDYVSLNQFVA